MPFLRFSRDRRGYESTYLLLSARRKGEQNRATLLYWFRTPPHVKLGRAAFDEETIRTIEEQHPDLEFDWTHILAARPPAAEPVEPVAGGRPPRRPVRRTDSPPTQMAVSRPERRLPVDARQEPVSPPRESEQPTPTAIASPALTPESLSSPVPPSAPATPDAPAGRRFIRVFDAPSPAGDQVGGPPTSETPGDEDQPRPHHLSEPSAVERMLGSDRLNRLRGQYAAYLARIGMRVADQVLAERLRGLAERANPDGWVTTADVEAGLAGLDDVYAELGRHVGRRRRRRRRQPGGDAAPESEPSGGNGG